MFEGIKSWMGRKSRGGIFTLSKARMMGQSFSEQVEEGYGNGWVMRCIRQRVEACSAAPLVLYRDRTKEKEIDRHPLMDLINAPNDQDSWPSIIEDLVGFRLLNGNSYLYAPPLTSHAPVELYALNAGATYPDKRFGKIVQYRYSTDAGQQTFLPADVMHWKCWNPSDPLIGLSPLHAAAMVVTQNNEAKRWNAALLQNMGRTSGVFSTDKNLTDEQFKRFKDELKTKFSGHDNAGRPMVLEGGLHWEQMGLNSVEMDWIEGQKLSMREICAIYNVPSQLVGDTEASTYSNYKEASKAFWRGTVTPDLAALRDELNRFLVPKFDKSRKLYLDFDLDGVDALQEDKDLMWTRLNSASWLTINEKRVAAGYDEITGGDVLLLPMTAIPQDINEPIEKEPTTEPAPAPAQDQDEAEE